MWDSDNEDVEWKPGKDKVMKLFIDFMSLILTLLFIFSHILPFYFFVLTLPPFLIYLSVLFFLSFSSFSLSHSLSLSLHLSISLSLSLSLYLSIYLSVSHILSLSLTHTDKHKLLPCLTFFLSILRALTFLFPSILIAANIL